MCFEIGKRAFATPAFCLPAEQSGSLHKAPRSYDTFMFAASQLVITACAYGDALGAEGCAGRLLLGAQACWCLMQLFAFVRLRRERCHTAALLRHIKGIRMITCTSQILIANEHRTDQDFSLGSLLPCKHTSDAPHRCTWQRGGRHARQTKHRLCAVLRALRSSLCVQAVSKICKGLSTCRK